ncbi:hypothetical protein BJ944DRAFT_266410, partial [Cunninghamella echinulata]
MDQNNIINSKRKKTEVNYSPIPKKKKVSPSKYQIDINNNNSIEYSRDIQQPSNTLPPYNPNKPGRRFKGGPAAATKRYRDKIRPVHNQKSRISHFHREVKHYTDNLKQNKEVMFNDLIIKLRKIFNKISKDFKKKEIDIIFMTMIENLIQYMKSIYDENDDIPAFYEVLLKNDIPSYQDVFPEMYNSSGVVKSDVGNSPKINELYEYFKTHNKSIYQTMVSACALLNQYKINNIDYIINTNEQENNSSNNNNNSV